MLHPHWLRTFLIAAAASSFSETARRLSFTQSTVSEHVRQLEAALGRRLFVRDTHSLALTPDGETLLVHARLILEAHQAAEAQFTGPKLRGRVRFGTSDDLVQGPLPDILAAFRRRHPDVDLDITIGFTDALYRELDAGKLDIITGKRRPGEERGHALHREALVWLAQAGARFDADRPLPLILLAEPSVTRKEALNALGEAGHRWQVVCSSGSYAACSAAARAGLGITVQPAHLPTAGLALPRVAAPLPALPDVQYVAVAARKLTAPAQTLLQILKETRIG
ncbi:LysR family transcriptional regulator [Dongia sp. agr-C8]